MQNRLTMGKRFRTILSKLEQTVFTYIPRCLEKDIPKRMHTALTDTDYFINFERKAKQMQNHEL